MFVILLWCLVVFSFYVITDGGYTKQSMDSLLFLLTLRYGDNLFGLSMLELGDQIFVNKGFPSSYEPFVRYDFTNQIDRDPVPAKTFFTHIGINHTSIDWNGLNGAIKLDLRQDLSQFHNKTYDIITNLGFTEHVGEQDLESNLIRNQYATFRNLHYFGKIDTLYYHYVPRSYHWHRHGVCDYDKNFFKELIRLNNYETVLAPTYIDKGFYQFNNMILICFIKVNNDPFMSFEEFKQLPNLRSKYDDHNVREVVLSYVSDDGTASTHTLKVDVTKSSIHEEANKFCSQSCSEIALVNDCIALVVENILSQGIDGKSNVL